MKIMKQRYYDTLGFLVTALVVYIIGVITGWAISSPNWIKALRWFRMFWN